jgi:hypothetical protein
MAAWQLRFTNSFCENHSEILEIGMLLRESFGNLGVGFLYLGRGLLVYGFCMLLNPLVLVLFPGGGFVGFFVLLCVSGVLLCLVRWLFGNLLSRLLVGVGSSYVTEARCAGDVVGRMLAFRGVVGVEGGFELLGRLGEVGILSTYGVREGLGALRVRALRVVSAAHRGDEFGGRLLKREGLVLRALSGLSVCPKLMREGELEDGGGYLLTSFGTGLRLSHFRGELCLSDVRRLLLGVGGALSRVHKRGVVHGSLDLSKVLVDGLGGVMIYGFEYGCREGDRCFSVVGSGGSNFAPEQLEGGVQWDVSVDVYGFAGMAFELLTGRVFQVVGERQFEEEEMEEMLKEVGLGFEERRGMLACMSIVRDERLSLRSFLRMFSEECVVAV